MKSLTATVSAFVLLVLAAFAAVYAIVIGSMAFEEVTDSSDFTYITIASLAGALALTLTFLAWSLTGGRLAALPRLTFWAAAIMAVAAVGHLLLLAGVA